MSSILSQDQIDILSLLSKEKLITDSFYLSGGTALAEFYLQHRLSEDLDFFSEKEFDPLFITSTFKKLQNDAHIIKINYEQSFNRNLFFLELENGTIKTEFTFFPFPRIESKKKFGDLYIDSLIDIFDTYLNPIQLSSQFVKVEVLKDYPNMIQKIDDKEWQSFFMRDAKRLAESVLE